MSTADKLREWKQWIDAHSPTEWDDAFRSSLQSGPGINLGYVVYRYVQLVLDFMLIVVSILEINSFNVVLDHNFEYYAKWLLYIPNWMLCANMFQAFLGAVVVSVSRKADGSVGVNIGAVPPGSSTQKVADSYKMLFNTAANLSAYIAVGTAGVYAMSSPSFVQYSPKAMIDWKIGVSVLLMIVDLFVVRFRYVLLNLYSVFVLSAYLLLTWVHYLVGAADRYTNKPKPLLDWSNPTTVVLSFVSSVVLMEMMNVMLFGLYQVRREFVTRGPTGHHQIISSASMQASLPTDTGYSTDHDESAPDPSETSKRGKKKKINTRQQDKTQADQVGQEAPDGQGSHSHRQEDVAPQPESESEKKPSIKRSRDVTPGK